MFPLLRDINSRWNEQSGKPDRRDFHTLPVDASL